MAFKYFSIFFLMIFKSKSEHLNNSGQHFSILVEKSLRDLRETKVFQKIYYVVEHRGIVQDSVIIKLYGNVHSIW